MYLTMIGRHTEECLAISVCRRRAVLAATVSSITPRAWTLELYMLSVPTRPALNVP